MKDFIGDVLPINFMRDRQKGIINALQIVWPTTRSCFCARHVYANFRKKKFMTTPKESVLGNL